MIVSPVDLVERIRREYVADGRLKYADLRVEQRPETVAIAGVVLERPDAEFLLGRLSAKAPGVNWRDETSTLVSGPDYTWAINSRAVVDVRRDATTGSERVTQLIFGERIEVLRRVADWAFIRASDGYLGWVRSEPLAVCTPEAAREWVSSTTHLVRQPLAACYADASGEPHQQIMLLPFGAPVHVDGADGAYRRIRVPGSRGRWVPATDLLPVNELWHTGITGLQTVVNWAQALVGVPYLWGGKTPFGYDCSGMCQMFFSMIGVHIRRDADQQFAEGQAVAFEEVEFGDLLFFDTSASDADLATNLKELRVSHVALALDGQDFLHASSAGGGVVRGSFDTHSPWYTPTFRLRFLGARRYV